MDTAADKRMELAIARMLRVGVTLSAAVVLLGGILYLAESPLHIADYSHFHTAASNLINPARIIRGIGRLDPSSIMQAGILILIATPVVRVAFCIVGFALQKDRLYLFISTAVLAILVYSLLRGGS